MAEERDGAARAFAVLAHVVAFDLHRSAVGPQRGGEDAQQGGLARSIAARDHDHGAFGQLESDVHQRPATPISAVHAGCTDCDHARMLAENPRRDAYLSIGHVGDPATAAHVRSPPMARALHTCMLCEAVCGLALEVEGGSIAGVRGDADDPFSRVTSARRRQPSRTSRTTRIGFASRCGGKAIAGARCPGTRRSTRRAQRMAQVQRKHGRSAVALYVGNPTVHSATRRVLRRPLFARALGIAGALLRHLRRSAARTCWPRWRCSATSC